MEAIYYSDILGILTVAIGNSDNLFLQNDQGYIGIRTVTREQALKYILRSGYELIGYV